MNDENPNAVCLELDAQLRRLESIADPAARSAATDLLAAVLQFHAAVLGRMLQAIAEHSGDAKRIFADFNRDPVIRSALLIHDLHPEPLQARVTRALAELEPRLKKRGATVELIAATEDAVRLRVTAAPDAHGPFAPAVEQAIREAAPEAAEVIVEERGARRADFVPLEAIQSGAEGDAAAHDVKAR